MLFVGRQSGIDIFVFDDRLEIKSPGPLLSTIIVKDLEQLQGLHESCDIFVATVLRENRYMRELGEGVRRMFNLMGDNALAAPKLFSNSVWFSVTLINKVKT